MDKKIRLLAGVLDFEARQCRVLLQIPPMPPRPHTYEPLQEQRTSTPLALTTKPQTSQDRKELSKHLNVTLIKTHRHYYLSMVVVRLPERRCCHIPPTVLYVVCVPRLWATDPVLLYHVKVFYAVQSPKHGALLKFPR